MDVFEESYFPLCQAIKAFFLACSIAKIAIFGPQHVDVGWFNIFFLCTIPLNVSKFCIGWLSQRATDQDIVVQN